MKRVAMLLVFTTALCPALFAQDEDELNHGTVGIYADYFRLRDVASGNFWGLGARASFNVHEFVQLEAEMNYDFERSVTEGFTRTTPGGVLVTPGLPLDFSRSGLRILHGLFGPKIQSSGALRPFIVLKGGFINFRFDDRPATFGTFFSSLEDVRSNNVNGVFYPGGGIEMYAGPIGLRLEIGDEMYFSDGAKHNLRIVFGPQIRF
ncbi:MAG: hypothetical protein HYX72_14050 [Acidobacteria bacterium]|nr:hypothetical protein [Acidobacteriota bacterium]